MFKFILITALSGGYAKKPYKITEICRNYKILLAFKSDVHFYCPIIVAYLQNIDAKNDSFVEKKEYLCNNYE